MLLELIQKTTYVIYIYNNIYKTSSKNKKCVAFRHFRFFDKNVRLRTRLIEELEFVDSQGYNEGGICERIVPEVLR